MDEGKRAVGSAMDQQIPAFGRSTKTGKYSEAPERRHRVLFDYWLVPLIIPLLRDRGFKSRPRNQSPRMNPAVYRVYVLQNSAGKFYVGVSGDVDRRLGEHNAGGSKWTKGRGPWRLAWQSGPMLLGAARKLENCLKRQGRGTGFYSITGLPRPTGS